jgi:hypothetical protein
MKNIFSAAAILAFSGALAHAHSIVETSAYSWHGDTITQGEFFATAPSANKIISTYSAQPGYFMPISKTWVQKNDISKYPTLSTPNTLHTAIYNMGLDEMVNAVEPDTTLRTGKEWPGVWTRDVSYSILLSMAYLQPEATRISLMRKVDSEGRIIQDTGSGGAWPISTDRMIWAVAAYEYYKVTGDRDWLKYIYPIIKKSLYDDVDNNIISANGLVKGETSFIDWREQSYPRWMQTADIYQSEALSTSVVHAEAWKILSNIASELGDKKIAAQAIENSQRIANAINTQLWMTDKGYYAMYRYGRDNLITNPRAETLGEALSILWNIAPADRAASITEHNPTTPFGAAIFYPQISDMPAYHNNALWPWVASWWALANAKVGNENGVMQAIGSVFRPAALFATNKENFNLDNGDIATELNSSNMLWCLSGNIAITHKILFGIQFEKDGLSFSPFVPQALAAERSLSNFAYRDAVLNITVKGFGKTIKSFTVNGKSQSPFITAKQAKGSLNIIIEMDNSPITPMAVNNVNNAKAPLTPTTWLEGTTLTWNPIEYIKHYIIVHNGERIAQVHTTSFDASTPGEYQVIGVNDNGIESFASEPRSTRSQIITEIPGESTNLSSTEIAYKPEGKISGYYGNGFIELDHKTAPVNINVNIDEAGTYTLKLRYANGNGPVNTENRCAIRAISVDGTHVGTIVMPQRGRANWDDWGFSNSITIPFTKGAHTITVHFIPANQNMNITTNHALIDRLILTKAL